MTVGMASRPRLAARLRVFLVVAPWPMDGYVIVALFSLLTYVTANAVSTSPPTWGEALVGASIMVAQFVVGLPVWRGLRRWCGRRERPPRAVVVILVDIALATALSTLAFLAWTMTHSYPLIADRGAFVLVANSLWLAGEFLLIAVLAGARSIRSRARQVHDEELESAAARVSLAATLAVEGLERPRALARDLLLPELRRVDLDLQRDDVTWDVEQTVRLAARVDGIREERVRQVSRALADEAQERARTWASATVVDREELPVWPPVSGVLRGVQPPDPLDCRGVPCLDTRWVLAIQGLCLPLVVLAAPGDPAAWLAALALGWGVQALILIPAMVLLRRARSACSPGGARIRMGTLAAAGVVSGVVVGVASPSGGSSTMLGVSVFLSVVLYGLIAEEVRIQWSLARSHRRRVEAAWAYAERTSRDAVEQVNAASLRAADLLHSTVQARLAAITGMLLATVRSEYSLPIGEVVPEVRRSIDDLTTMVSGEIVDAIDPDALDVEVARSPRSLVQQLADDVRGVAPHVEAIVQVDPAASVSPAQRDAMRVIVREAVANAVRHGRARVIEVTVAPGAGGSVLRVSDDGRGLPATIEPGLGSRILDGLTQTAAGEWSLGVGADGGATIEFVFHAAR